MHVVSKGFLRNQVRMMMAQLFKLGKGEITLKYIQDSLKPEFSERIVIITKFESKRIPLNRSKFAEYVFVIA